MLHLQDFKKKITSEQRFCRNRAFIRKKNCFFSRKYNIEEREKEEKGHTRVTSHGEKEHQKHQTSHERERGYHFSVRGEREWRVRE